MDLFSCGGGIHQRRRLSAILCGFAALTVVGCAHIRVAGERVVDRSVRTADIQRAQIWSATDVPSMDIKTGPSGPATLVAARTVVCDYVPEKSRGASPKFWCTLDDRPKEKVKVKFGRENGEVYGEVAATRLLWALGFGADREYPAQVICRGCPARLKGKHLGPNETLFEVAAIERKMKGHELDGPDGPGWSWRELEAVDPRQGGAPLAQRDALKLLAVLLQHTDSKREQQRLVCLDAEQPRGAEPCSKPFMLINDLGLTFGRANTFNRQPEGSVNLRAWSRTQVWHDPKHCIGNLHKSWTGTLDNPHISEEGRQFLAGLLTALTDRQLHDLFEVARFPLRTRMHHASEEAKIQAWVDAFKSKIQQVVNHSCAPTLRVPAN